MRRHTTIILVGAELPVAGLPSAMGALVAVLAVFLPEFLLLSAVLSVWARLARRRWAASTMAGINAAVVGLRLAAFYDPVCTESIRGPMDAAIASIGFWLAGGHPGAGAIHRVVRDRLGHHGIVRLVAAGTAVTSMLDA